MGGRFAAALVLAVVMTPHAGMGQLPDSGRIDENNALGIPRYGSPSTANLRAMTGPVSEPEMADGLREVLRMGTDRAIRQLGAADGFGGDRFVNIPLPETVSKDAGDAKASENLRTGINQAAEVATAEAGPVFIEAIRAVALNDARRILSGTQTAATQTFRQQMTPLLRQELRPVVERALVQAGSIAAYEALVGDVTSETGTPDAKTALVDHVLNRTLIGIFHYIGQQEVAVRTNPAVRTTPLLQRVFAETARAPLGSQPTALP